MTEIEHARDVVDEYVDLCYQETNLEKQLTKLQEQLKGIRERKEQHASVLQSTIQPDLGVAIPVVIHTRAEGTVVVVHQRQQPDGQYTHVSIVKAVAAREHP